MSTNPSAWDLSDLEEMWERRRARLESLLPRIDRRGMTRPRRNLDERAWLEERGELSEVREIETPLNDQGSTPQPRAPRQG